ncbi:hypothetical protein KBB12_00240 [Candidatus Woesebacteria bacterium]|nr:hypothetical protein [Candidatus Woesebacteria bacterium]
MKIVSVDKVEIHPDHVETLKRYGEVVIYNDIPSEDEGIQRIGDADIVIDNWFKMPARVIASCQKLKMIAVAATGYEWIDMQEARKNNILISNTPHYCTEAVAEHAISLMLQASRMSYLAEKEIRQGKWGPAEYKGKELRGKVLGIIGYGNIGRRIAEIMTAGFGMDILFVNSSSSSKDLEKLLTESDFISINAPINKNTNKMIGQKEFNLMKKGVVLVNTGRGAIINEDELYKNLKSHKISAAGLDVLSHEPMQGNNSLFTLDNVVISPHIAYNTEESIYQLSSIVVENILGFLEGKPQNVVS